MAQDRVSSRHEPLPRPQEPCAPATPLGPGWAESRSRAVKGRARHLPLPPPSVHLSVEAMEPSVVRASRSVLMSLTCPQDGFMTHVLDLQ